MRDFNYTVNVLAKAFINGTLEHGKCSACAVGNIIADCMGTAPASSNCPDDSGFHFTDFENGYVTKWHWLFMTTGRTQERREGPFKGHLSRAVFEVEQTGYTVDEMASIESAFESAPGRPEGRMDGLNEEWMFNGLIAVVDVLARIHEIDLTQKEAAKLLFVK